MAKRNLSVIRNLYPLLLNAEDELINNLADVKVIASKFVKDHIPEGHKDRLVMLKNITDIHTIDKIYDYFANSLLVWENRPYFYRISGNKFVRFTNICKDGNSEWDQKVG